MKAILDYKIDHNQQAFLDLILEIDEICRKYDIRYTLGYGTLLGAIRHEGFIPWDNDIDINLSERDYNRFVEACKTELDGKNRILCDSRILRGYPKVYGRYYDLNCCRLSDKVNYWENICGRGVDIFYQLEVPPGEKGREYIDYFYAYDEYVNGVYRHYRMKTDRVMAFYQEAQAREKQIGRLATLEEMEARIFNRSFDNVEWLVDSSARYTSPNPISRKAYYDHPKRVLFEGHLLPVPGDYLEVLRNLYGDDFNLFPAEPKFVTEITYDDIPYRDCVTDFMQYLNRDELERVHREYKEAAVEEGRRSTEIMTAYYKAYALSIRNHILQRIEKEQLDLNGLLHDGGKDARKKLDSLFGEYYTRQLAESPLYWRCLFDIGDELLDAALHHLFYNRKEKAKVVKLLRLLRQNDRELTPEMQEIQGAMDMIWNCRKAFYYKDYPAAKRYGALCVERCGEQQELREIMIQVEYALAASEEERRACRANVDKLLEKSPKNAYYRKVSADLHYDSGDCQAAKAIYDDLMDNCLDGMLLLDVKHRLAAMAACSEPLKR